MAIDFSYIDHDVLGDIADAIRFIEGSTASITPADYPQRIRALDKYIPDYDVLNFYMPNGGTISLNKTGKPTVVELEYWLDENAQWFIWQPDSNGNRSLTLTAGQRMYLRNTSETPTLFTLGQTSYYRFGANDDTYANGNVNSLMCRYPNTVVSISNYCFYNLFYSFVKLKTPPLMPSQQLGTHCYRYAFAGSGISESPILPAQFITSYAYFGIFQNCSNLQKVTIYATSIEDMYSTFRWMRNVPSNGDFYCPASLTIPTGESGIPSSWTRHDLTE